jgi:thiamine-phosphate pyrophosphorylase
MKPIVCYVTDRKSLRSPDSNAALLEKIRLAAEAGADWIQIREKDLPGGRLLALTRDAAAAAEQIANARRVSAPACRGGPPGRGVRIYVNDRLDVAIAAATAGRPAVAGQPTVAGVHLGGESLPVEEVVRWCRAGNAPPELQIGVSCHSIEAAREAEQNGADYIFLGPIFDTPSKRSLGSPQGLDRLREVCKAIHLPLIAIGGVNETNAQDCIRAGASGIAAIRLFQEAPDAEELDPFISALRG